MKVIPIYASAGVSGFESPAAEYTQLALSLDDILIQHPNATFIGLASGDSMQGVGIFCHDLLIVDRHVHYRDQEVIVANFNGEFVCKILDVKARMLRSTHPTYQPIPIRAEDTFTIEGVVTRSIRCHRPIPELCLR